MERLQCPENSWCRIWRGATWFFTQFWPRRQKPLVAFVVMPDHSLTGIFTLAQNMGSAVHRWLQAWNMDPSITWTLLLRTWNQNIISNPSLFFCQTHLHCRRGVGVVGASQKTCRFHWIGRKIPSRGNTSRGLRMRRISQSIYCRWTDTEEPCK